MNIALIYCKLSSANSSKDWIRIWMEKRVERNRINGFFVILFYCWYQNKSKIGMKILIFCQHISSNTLPGGIIFDPVKLVKEIVSCDPIGWMRFWSSRFIFEIKSLKYQFFDDALLIHIENEVFEVHQKCIVEKFGFQTRYFEYKTVGSKTHPGCLWGHVKLSLSLTLLDQK